MADAGESWIDVAAESEVAGVMPRHVVIDGEGWLLCRDARGVHAVQETCPHKNESMRYGVVMGTSITCPHHQWTFDLETGRCAVRRRCPPLRTLPVRIVDGRVHVQRPQHPSQAG